MFKKLFISTALAAVMLAGCQDTEKTSDSAAKAEAGFTLPVETYQLDNGLTVVLHQDRSDPIVAINLAAHVGSARETPGRTGFAHLFEHLLFLDSENLGYGGLDAMNTRIGGEGTNGFTTHDMTQYFQAVPADALEKVIWAEADKLCCFINVVTQPMVDVEKQVVKNEKRQRVDNAPYGHMLYIVNKAIYPDDHPYNWQVIGSLDDLEAASLDDVHNFFKRWYVPNNVTLTLTGDFEKDDAKALIEKYFGEIPRGPDIENYTPRAGALSQTRSLYYEDNFAQVPQLAVVWPTVPQYHPDSYAINVLMQYWTEGKDAPFNAVMIDEQKLTSNVTGFHYAKEIAGEAYIIVRSKSGEDIDGLTPGLDAAFARFEQDGMSEEALSRIKTKAEVDFYGNYDSVLGKSIALGEYATFTGDPAFFKNDLQGLQSVTLADVQRVYTTYFKDRPRLYVSIVPKGQAELKLDGDNPAQPAAIIEEKVVEGAEKEVNFDPSIRDFTPTPSAFDRTVEPPFGPAYTLPKPEISESTSANGISILGMTTDETPLVNFTLYIDAGYNRADPALPATARLAGDMLLKGTQSLDTAALEDAIKSLGSDISVSVTPSGVYVSGQSLARNLAPTLALVEQIVLTPRWDAEEFALLKDRRLAEIDQAKGDPNSIATRAAAQIAYPESHPLHYEGYAPASKLSAVTLEDVKGFHARYYRPQNAALLYVGQASSSDFTAGLPQILGDWSGETLADADLPQMEKPAQSQVYFVDVPGAKQSVIRLFRPSVTANDPDFARLDGLNLLLGGIYTSDLMTELRVNKGYTYGIGSGFNEGKDRGTFTVRTSVRSNVTAESLEIIRSILDGYGGSFDDEKLQTLKDALLRGQALKAETAGDKLSLLRRISAYGYPHDFRAKGAEEIAALTLEDVGRLTAEQMTADPMIYLIVGDAATQKAKVEALGIGPVIDLEVKWD